MPIPCYAKIPNPESGYADWPQGTYRYKLYDDSQTKAQFEALFFSKDFAQRLAFTDASVPAVPGGYTTWTVRGTSSGGGALQGIFVNNIIESNDTGILNVTFDHYDSTNDEVWYHATEPNTKFGQDSRTWMFYRNEEWFTVAEFNACPHKPRQPLRCELYLVDTSQPFVSWRESSVFWMYIQHVNYI